MTAQTTQGSSVPHRLSFQTRDVDEYRAILSTHHAPVMAEPLSRELFTVGANAVLTGGISLSRVVCATGVSLTFENVFDGYGLSLPASGSFAVEAAGHGRIETRQGMGLMMDSSSVKSAVLGPHTNLPRISVTSEAMHNTLAEMIDQPILRRIRFAQDVCSRSPAAIMASSFSRLIYDGVEGDAPLLKYPAALASLQEAILHLILEAIPHSYSDQMSRQARLLSSGNVKRAIDFMVANAAKPLRLSDIAAASNTSVRSLQGGFMRFRGMSPMSYLRKIRLNGARAELLMAAPGATVSHIAYTWGFANLSYFSTLYLRSFGESPSTTLRRGYKI